MSDSKNLTFNESISLHDKFKNVNMKSSGLWAKTEVLCSNADIIYDCSGKSSFAPGAPFTKSTNMVPIGGVEFVMELLFGVQCSQFQIPTLYSESGIGLKDSLPVSDNNLRYRVPDTENGVAQYKYQLYRPGHLINSFGVGITGTAENDVTVHPVDYREKSISMTRVTADGLTLNGDMIPFRYTDEQLNSTERQKYFGKYYDSETGATAYFLKRFEADPVIKHIWKTSTDIEDETLVSAGDVWDNTTGLNMVESFTEIILKVSAKDVKDWFIHLEQADRARINTLALFSGRFVIDDNVAGDYGDYQDVRLFSKMNITTEYLSLNKDLNIIYRVYGA